MKSSVYTFLLFAFFFTDKLFTQSPIIGHWEGSIDVMNQHIGMMIDFSQSGDSVTAAIDIPMQGATGLKLQKIRFEAPQIHFELPAGPTIAIFDGTHHGDSIAGAFTQAGFQGSFVLKRAVRKEAEKEVDADAPYKKEEVVFTNDTIKLAGTLTLPQSKGPHPAVSMITGSGPQNRDEELFGFKPFKVIADHFTRNGIAVLRYDDRGVGGSTGNTMQSTTVDFAADALAAVRYLQTRSEINHKQIGLCGHSEGGIVAPLAASQSKDVAFIILIAGTGVNGENILKMQTELIMRADSATEDEIAKALAMNSMIYSSLRTDRPLDSVKSELRKRILEDYEKLPDEQRKFITDKDQYVHTVVEAQALSFTTPWFKHFLIHDPAPALEKARCPVLALFGQYDLQVPAETNKKAIQAALLKAKNRDVTMKIFPNANHLFLYTRTGSLKEYATMKKEFVPGFLETMSKWILEQVTIVKD